VIVVVGAILWVARAGTIRSDGNSGLQFPAIRLLERPQGVPVVGAP
jgi:hypothetical protein